MIRNFGNWIERPGTEKIYKICKQYSENLIYNLKQGLGITMLGSNGNGKSHLALSILAEAETLGYICVFKNTPTLLDRIRETMNGNYGFTSSEVIRALTDVDLLILDDVGAEKWSEWSEENYYKILNERYENCKATILTTNCDLKALERYIGKRNLDRIVEKNIFVRCNAESYRAEIAKKRESRER
jgi:DNA replication protein DnaC